MNLLLGTGAVFTLAFLFHIVLWRFWRPRSHTKGLLVIYFLAAVIFLALTSFGPMAGDYTGPDKLAFVILYLGLVFFYIINYSAVEADSPTFSLIMKLYRAHPTGLTKDQIRGPKLEKPFLILRLEQLESLGKIEHRDSKYVLRKSAFGPLKLIAMYRKIILGQSSGG